jgi:AraC-like DNA-binding protein
MADPPTSDSPTRMSTDAFPAAMRLSAWREIYGRNVAHFDIEPLDDAPFHADVTFHQLPGIGFAVGSRSDANYRMTPALAARARDNVIFGAVIQGTGFISQFNREATIAAGSAVLLSGNDPSAFALRDRGRGLTLSLPSDSFMPMIANRSGAFAKAIPAATAALRHLIEYLAIVQADFDSTSVELRRAIAQHIKDLAVLAVGATQEVTEIASRRGLRAARLLAIRREIDRRFADPDFALPALAAQLGVTPRYVQSLLAESGTSFIDEVIRRRLQRAHEMLCSQLYSGITIIDLAYHCGFASVSNFHRMFRRVFGKTPSDARAQALDGSTDVPRN